MISYDLHVHSCLSPAADEEMTPKRVIDRAVENGLDIIAIADTNSARNIIAASEVAEGRIAFVPAIEVESSEEVHVLCLFPDLASLNRMERIVNANMYDKPNKPEKFGSQLIVDEDDIRIGEEKRLLRFPTKMTIEEIFYAARQMNGAAVYAHLEQKAYSVLSILGTIPARPEPRAVEYTNSEKGKKFCESRKDSIQKPAFFNSDAYRLDDINTKENSADLEELGAQIRGEDGRVTARAFIDWLREQPGI